MNKVVVLVALLFFFTTFFVLGRKLEAKTIENKTTLSQKEETTKEMRAVYLSYIEIENYFKGRKKEEAIQLVEQMVDKISSFGMNAILLQVRPFSDAIYPSTIFPYSLKLVEKEEDSYPVDLLATFIEKAHQKDIQVHAWINPYRIRSSEDTSTITEKNPAYQYLGGRVVQVVKGKGIYYNPAKEETLQIILKGIKEILDKYEIDGIHFDDYFYPSTEIDTVEYQEYLDGGGNLSLSDFRINHILTMIKSVYQLVKEKNPSLLFGIAPEGNIGNNYDIHFLDINTILSKEGYVDYIMPQIYYGFLNETKPYLETISFWNSLIKNEQIKLIPALAFYKSGEIDSYAKSGSKEWIEHSDIIKRQVLLARNLSRYHGFSLFRYDSLFSESLTKNKEEEKKALQSLLK